MQRKEKFMLSTCIKSDGDDDFARETIQTQIDTALILLRPHFHAHFTIYAISKCIINFITEKNKIIARRFAVH
jgi:hypothetical protein